MEIKIDKKLKQLRREKGITQEQLANYLNVSYQAIGKWERGEGYPDITLLPALAMYFGTTVDDLLDVGAERIQQKIDEYRDESAKLTNLGEVKKNYELWEKAYADLPNNEDVMCGRMYALFNMYNCETDEEKKKLISASLIEMGEKLIRSNDIEKRGCAVQVMTYHHKDIGETEKAVEYAKMNSCLFTSSDILLESILKGEKALKKCQSNIQTLADLLTSSVCKLKYIEGDYYSHEEKVELDRFCIKLYELVYDKGDYLFYAYRMVDIYKSLSTELAQLEKWDECLDALEKAMEFSILIDTQPDAKYTSLIVNKMEYKRSEICKNVTANESYLTINEMKFHEYDPIRDNPRFTAVIEKLEAYAHE